MHHFAYRNGVLHAEAVNLVKLAEQVGTPFYCYSAATLERHYRVFAEAFADVPSLVCYAVKANSNQAVIATLARLGSGADVVSGGELKRALAAGIPLFELVHLSGLVASKGEARKLIRGGGVRINDSAITNEGESITAGTTVTLAAPKLPLVLPPAENRAGDIVIADIGIPADVIDAVDGRSSERKAKGSALSGSSAPSGPRISNL